MALSTEDMQRELLISGSVVTLRDVLNRLDSLLSEDEINEFVAELLAETELEVRPGELITADLMNRIIGQLSDLNERVTILEHSVIDNRVPVITDVIPREVHVGQRLEVYGYNFPEDTPAGSVELDEVPIERFIEQSAEKLVFGVPRTISGLPKDAVLRIRNGELSASTEVYVLPEQALPEGSVTVQDNTPDLGEIIIGDDYTLVFEIRSTTNIAEVYSISHIFIEITGLAGEDDWKAASELVLAGGGTVPEELLIAPGSPVTVHLNLTIPDDAEAATVVVNATSINNPDGITSTPASKQLVVGEAPPVNDPRVVFVVNEPTPTSHVRVVQENGNTIYEIPYNETQSLFVEARYQTVDNAVSGRYEYAYRLLPDEDYWPEVVVTPAFSNEVVPSAESIRIQLTLEDMTPDSNHPETRTLEVSATHVADANAEEFVSWVNIIIRGYERVV